MQEVMSAMYCEKRYFEVFAVGGRAKFTILVILLAVMGFPPAAGSAQEPGQKTFPTAAAACHALVTAVQVDDRAALRSILGPQGEELFSSGDAAENKAEREEFVQKYRQMHRLVTEPDGKTTLYIGAENWPTPIPLVQKNGAWYFDTAAGKQEILYRRIGQNELTVIQVCHELVNAEKEYDAQPRAGESDKQYAQKILSNPGQQNGLYWKTTAGQPESPIGLFIAQASAEGDAKGATPEPFYGYYFRILTAQGPNATGGARSYIADGKMTGGFAFLAYPAEYRSSGVMTFILNQDGTVYEKDLGPGTAEIAKTITSYNPDATWHPVK